MYDDKPVQVGLSLTPNEKGRYCPENKKEVKIIDILLVKILKIFFKIDSSILYYPIATL